MKNRNRGFKPNPTSEVLPVTSSQPISSAGVDPGMIKENPDPMMPKNAIGFLEAPKWEYQSVAGSRLLNLSGFGSEGWELTAVIGQPGDQAVFYFRRIKT
jgi:hypothetical protein